MTVNGRDIVKYDNTVYWTNLYKKHESMLKAAGHPTLSEKLNELKYKSEARTLLSTLEEISQRFRRAGREELSIQDVGTGFGYWAKLGYQYFTDPDGSIQGFLDTKEGFVFFYMNNKWRAWDLKNDLEFYLRLKLSKEKQTRLDSLELSPEGKNLWQEYYERQRTSMQERVWN